jgi:uncharacterized protein
MENEMNGASDPGLLFVGYSDKPETMRLDRANRHGLVAGATGTGKTVTLQILAQGFSDAGVPVFAADVKGDLSGICQPGTPNEKMLARAAGMKLELRPDAPPTVFWDLFGEKGHPVRTTVSEMGPLLLARMLELNDVQEGVLNIVFKVADAEGLLLLDFKDLQAALKYVAENEKEIDVEYGNVSAATIGTIQRGLLTLETQGGANLFGEPALLLSDLMRVDGSGRGVVSVLAADRLIQSPRLYATFLLWLLAELFEELPEIGDPEKPRLVFFFDEAHLLFRDAPKALLEKVEQVVRLIRSKGVGIYFVTQNPADIPDTVLAQLGNRFQHALRAYTPAEQKGLRAAASSFRPHPGSGRGRGPGLGAGREGRALCHRPGADPAARLAAGPGHGGRARRGDRRQPGARPLRHGEGPRVGLRAAQGPGRAGDAPGGGRGGRGGNRQTARGRREGLGEGTGPPRPRRQGAGAPPVLQPPDHGRGVRQDPGPHHRQPGRSRDPARRAGELEEAVGPPPGPSSSDLFR